MAIKINTRQLNKLVMDAVKAELEERIINNKASIKIKLGEVFRTHMQNTPEYDSLVNDRGRLRYHFGLTDAKNKVDDIIREWSENIYFEIKKRPFRLEIGMVASDYRDVFRLFASDQETEKGQVLPWLSWLLIEGESPIVKGYGIRIGPSEASRTGFAVMVESKTKRKNWSVPEFAGTPDDNWVTRAIDGMGEDFIRALIDGLDV